MENTIQIQLGESKYVDSVNEDQFIPISLECDIALLTEYGIDNVLNVNDQYELERQSSTTYRIYGEMEYLSILNNIKSNYTNLEDFFTVNENGKNIFNSFEFYIVKQNNSYANIYLAGNAYLRYFEKISDISINILPAGYSKNVFNEKTYVYIANNLINIDNKTLTGTTNTNQPYFPITDLYLYCKYVPNNGETLEYYDVQNSVYYPYVTEDIYNMNGDVILWDKSEYTQTEYISLTHRITSIYTNYSGGTSSLEWEYNPLIKIPIDILSDDLTTVISGGTNDYDDPIPSYATLLDNGNYVWREIEEKGFVNPLTNNTINPPFTNNSHYIFNKLKLFVTPNLLHDNTNYVFNMISSLSQKDLGNKINNLDGLNNKC